MSEDVAKSKRQAATGLGMKIKPMESEDSIDSNPSMQSSSEIEKAPSDAHPKSRLPVIQKPIFREASVSARTTTDNKRQLDELAKISGRSVSYLVSELLDAFLPEWIELQKKSYPGQSKK